MLPVPWLVKGKQVRAVAEVSPKRRQLEKAQAIWPSVTAGKGIPTEVSDCKWFDTMMSISVRANRIEGMLPSVIAANFVLETKDGG